MKQLIIPTLLAAVTAMQLICIERVGAEEAAATSTDPIVEKASSLVDGLVIRTAATTKLAAERDSTFEALAKLPYVVEPPDILLIEGVNLTPKSPHRLETFDVVLIRVVGALPEQPIDNSYNIDADGGVNLGPTYGRVHVVGLTVKKSEAAIHDALSKKLSDAKVSVSLVATAGTQQITGQHLVAADGRVNLGAYGSVYVAGMTLEKVRTAIERRLAKKFEEPEVVIDVLAYNSKVVYVIEKDGRGHDNVVRLPTPYPLSKDCNVGSVLEQTGSRAYKLAEAKILLRRPAPNGVNEELVLPIACDPSTDLITPETNYPLLPGDRLFIRAPGTASSAPTRTRFSPSGESSILPPQRYRAYVYPTTAPPAPQANPPAVPRDGSVAFKISILEDPDCHLAEFESLRDRFMLDETGTTRDALRVLERNGLIRCVANPELISRLGDTCEVKMSTSAADKDQASQNELAIEVSARELGDHLLVKIHMERGEGGVKTSIDTNVNMESKQTVILAANGPPAKSKGEAVERRTYLVLTPTLVK